MASYLLQAVCVRRKKNSKENYIKKNITIPPHHKIDSSRATATTSRRRATKGDPRVSLCSPASIDHGVVEPRTALAIRRNDECYTHKQTNRLIK